MEVKLPPRTQHILIKHDLQFYLGDQFHAHSCTFHFQALPTSTF